MDEPAIKQEETALTARSTAKAIVSPQEIVPVAYQMAKSYQRMVEHFHKHYKMEIPEAFAKTEELIDPSTSHPNYLDKLRNGPPQDTDWWQLNDLARNDPEAMTRRWQGIKQAALDDLVSGHHAAEALEGSLDRPWDRAQFLALRQSLMEEWKPINGIEQSLIDTMAQVQTIYFYWMKQLAVYMNCEVQDQQNKYDMEGNWLPPRVSHEAATEQAAAMVDRFNKLFLRTLRQLRDLRRYTPQVTIQNAGQVNIAGGQQMNLAKVEAPEPLDG